MKMKHLRWHSLNRTEFAINAETGSLPTTGLQMVLDQALLSHFLIFSGPKSEFARLVVILKNIQHYKKLDWYILIILCNSYSKIRKSIKLSECFCYLKTLIAFIY